MEEKEKNVIKSKNFSKVWKTERNIRGDKRGRKEEKCGSENKENK